MAFDPSVIGSIGENVPDVGAAIGKGVQLREMMDRSQLSRLQTQSAQRQASEDAQVQDILRGSKYDTAQGVDETAAKINRVSPRAAMDFKSKTQAYSSGQVQSELEQLQLSEARSGVVIGAIDPIVSQARSMKSKGASDLEVNAFIAQQMPTAIQSLRSQMLSDGRPALPDETLKAVVSGKMDLPTLESYEQRSKTGQGLIKQRLEQLKADTSVRKEDESERHNRAMESNATARTDIAKAKVERDASGGLTPAAVDEVSDRYMAGDTSVMQGLSKEDRRAIQNHSADVAQIMGLTGKDLAARRAEYQGIMAGQRTLAQRQANIDTAAQEFSNVAPTVIEAARDLPRSAFVPWNKMVQIWEHGTSDERLAKFAQGAKTLANLYTRATVPGASSVSDREDALSHVPTYTDEKSFEATVSFMEKEIEAARKSPRDVRADLSAEITNPGRSKSPAGAPTGAAASPSAAGAAPAGGPAAIPAGWTVTEH